MLVEPGTVNRDRLRRFLVGLGYHPVDCAAQSYAVFATIPGVVACDHVRNRLLRDWVEQLVLSHFLTSTGKQ